MLKMFIGLDCSTQSLKLQVINELKQLQEEVIINYDDDLPHYKTINGVIRYTNEKLNIEHIATPTLLFIEALELAFDRLKNLKFNFASVKGISGSGQQHGSVNNQLILLLMHLKINKFYLKRSGGKKIHLLCSRDCINLIQILLDQMEVY
jgi:hypothetical protein